MDHNPPIRVLVDDAPQIEERESTVNGLLTKTSLTSEEIDGTSRLFSNQEIVRVVGGWGESAQLSQRQTCHLQPGRLADGPWLGHAGYSSVSQGRCVQPGRSSVSQSGGDRREKELDELKKGESDAVRPCCFCTRLHIPWPWKMRAAISKQTQARLAAQVESLFCYSMLIEKMTWCLQDALLLQAPARWVAR